MGETVIVGYVTFTWINLVSQWLAYAHAAMAVIFLLFRSTVLVPFYWRWGSVGNQYLAKLRCVNHELASFAIRVV